MLSARAGGAPLYSDGRADRFYRKIDGDTVSIVAQQRYTARAARRARFIIDSWTSRAPLCVGCSCRVHRNARAGHTYIPIIHGGFALKERGSVAFVEEVGEIVVVLVYVYNVLR